MVTYVPNATQATEPVESQTVESAALEFRTLKLRTNQLDTTVANNLATLVAADSAIIAAQVAGDADIVAYVSPYIDAVAAANFMLVQDLGFIYDPVAPFNYFDLGTI